MKKFGLISLLLVFSFVLSVFALGAGAVEEIDFVPELRSGRIYGISLGATEEDVRTAFYGSDIEVTDKNGAMLEVGSSTPVGTGFTVSVNGVYYSAVVMGDVDGDSVISAVDYILVKRAVLGTGTLGVLGREAAGVENGEELRAIHYIKLKRAYFGTYDINYKYSCDPYLPDMGEDDSEVEVSGWH